MCMSCFLFYSYFKFKVSTVFFSRTIFSSECCDTIEVHGQGGPVQRQRGIFDTYTLEQDLVNGHKHYTSQDGTRALAYNTNDNEWKLQATEKR